MDIQCSSVIPTVQVLGIPFFNGDVSDAIALISRGGGFLIAPSATCFTRLQNDEIYRRAVLAADLAIADSGFMVLLWHSLQHESVNRISGLKYLKHLLAMLRDEGNPDVFWVLPTERGQRRLED